MQRGLDELFEAALLPGRLERTVTPTAIGERGGISVQEIAELMEAFGLPRPEPDEAVFTPAEARVFVELGHLDELWPAEVRLQVSRAYGAMLAGIARAELQAFQSYTEPHVRQVGGHASTQLLTIQAAFARLLPLADPLIVGIHRRWIEHELAQRAVRAAEVDAGPGALPGAVEVTFLFCDLKDFTAYAELSGDATAIAAVDRFVDVVAHERGPNGRVVKLLGDGAMLVYNDPVEAVRAGARVITALRGSGVPGVHASVHRGVAIARSGDYFGGSVNVAARLLGLAERDELLATAPVVDGCGTAFGWQPAGAHRLRGVTSPLTLFRLGGREIERAAALASEQLAEARP